MGDTIVAFSTDVLIVGAGPAGLAAALAATAQAGVTVTIIDENPAPGGQIWRGGSGQWRDSRAQALWDTLSQRTNLRIVYGARIVGRFGEQEFLLETADGAQTIRWEKCILCTGARELLLPFPGWTLPGVTGAGGLQALIKGGMPVKGKRVVIAGSGPLLLAVADTARRAGAMVVTIAEHRSTGELMSFFLALLRQHRGKFLQAIKLFWSLKQIAYRHDARVIKATGEQQLSSVSLQHGSKTLDLPCDFLACGFGLLPNPELGGLLACHIDEGSIQVDAHQASSQPAIWAAGEACGIGGVDKALAEGHIAGLAATGQTISDDALARRDQARLFAQLLNSSFAADERWRHLCQPDTLVCRCEDVSAQQLALHGDWRSAKLMTRAGMGACQGRICGAACQFLFGWQAPGMRPPVFPVKVSTLAALGTIGADHKQ
ncbi:NAD(P)/FAD-dependent oxidoreductase [Undibacterium sp. CY18W]|uniref:NAD(P)/FAD-dependent oxidoreductase n=1 Tax=Undibacterium hunanense TaxID=2762292 RepID=A0ABR6ZJA4_9BURK|nr:FAD/NAD(P)-binding oxidoreductase [Undibacterium hunanense]MBC3915958.1 NAD(P)/FAD-dependent oxidoreductase [Undibacterium hunanense]